MKFMTQLLQQQITTIRDFEDKITYNDERSNYRRQLRKNNENESEYYERVKGSHSRITYQKINKVVSSK